MSSDCPRVIVLFCQREMIRTFNSASEKPRPALTRRLYLIVGHRTIGLSLSTGRGATAAAFVRRAFRRRDLRPGYGMALAVCSEGHRWIGWLQNLKRAGRTWSKCVRTRRCQSLRKSVCHCYTSWSFERGQVELTIVLYLLIVLDRLSWLFKSVNVLQGQALSDKLIANTSYNQR